jgi:hypothetical protein
MDININPFSAGNPMSIRDAAIIAAIGAFAIWVLQFFANAQWIVIAADPAQWAFEAIKSYAVSWAGIFVTEAGLEQIVKRAQ